jgi:hypothetical protein
MGGWVLTVDGYMKFADLEDAGKPEETLSQWQ